MKNLVAITLLTVLTTGSAFAGTRDNDDTCDVKVGPAATLLLPYFEVDLQNPAGRTTLFTITNVSRLSQIAHVTVWTDWSFPVLDFNIFLTGYDVQGISLRQVLVQGIVAQNNGTGPTTAQSPLGSLSAGFTANPNFAGGGASINCAKQPGQINLTLLAAVRSALTTGIYNTGGSLTCATPVGGVHANAIGYVTIDVASNCSLLMPTDPTYYTSSILFDNVLIGDYQQLGPQPAETSAPGPFDAAGNPMVHIRAVPEGGPAGGDLVATGLPYTFYDRYTPATNRTADRRQPLPSTFAARFIEGGTSSFATNLTIWRESLGVGSCADVQSNRVMNVAEILRFDEHENVYTLAPCTSLCISPQPTLLPAASSTDTSSGIGGFLSSADVGGWLYMNLNNGGSTAYSVTHDLGGVRTVITGLGSKSDLAPLGSGTIGPRPSQNWVTATIFGSLGANRLSTEFDAASLGNGCSPAVASGAAIGPAGGMPVCPSGDLGCVPGVAPFTGTNVNPPP